MSLDATMCVPDGSSVILHSGGLNVYFSKSNKLCMAVLTINTAHEANLQVQINFGSITLSWNRCRVADASLNHNFDLLCWDLFLQDTSNLPKAVTRTPFRLSVVAPQNWFQADRVCEFRDSLQTSVLEIDDKSAPKD